jgi:hypothetical protein
MLGSFLPSLWSVMLPKCTQIEGADTFMKSAGQQIGDQHLSVPMHAPEPENTPHVGLDYDLGGLGLGLGLGH